MRHAFMILAVTLIASPTFAEEKKPQQTPAPDARQAGQQQQNTRRKVGRVLSQQGRMFTVSSEGKAFTFSGAKLKELPKVGEIVEITFTQIPGGPLEATTVKSSKSNSSERR